MSEELVVIEPTTTLEAFSSNDGLRVVVDSAIAEVEGFEHDMTTKAGRDKTRS